MDGTVSYNTNAYRLYFSQIFLATGSNECTSRMEARFGIMFTSAVYQGGWLALGLMSSVATTLVVCYRLCICTPPDEQEIARRLKRDEGGGESRSDRYEGSQTQRCHKILGAIVFCVGPMLLLVALFGMAGAKLTEFFAGKFLITSAGVRSPSDQDRGVAEGGPALIKPRSGLAALMRAFLQTRQALPIQAI